MSGNVVVIEIRTDFSYITSRAPGFVLQGVRYVQNWYLIYMELV